MEKYASRQVLKILVITTSEVLKSGTALLLQLMIKMVLSSIFFVKKRAKCITLPEIRDPIKYQEPKLSKCGLIRREQSFVAT